VHESAAPQKSRKKLVGIIAGAVLLIGAVAVVASQGGSDSTDADEVTSTTTEVSKSASTVPNSTIVPGNTSPSVGAAGSPQAIAQAVGNYVDKSTIAELAMAAVKYAIPIGILLAVLYGGKKLIDQVMSEDVEQGSMVREGQTDLDTIKRLLGK
jgi:uncharacterized membrane protein (DUF4010 family)